jgi:beta-galactosidase
MAALACVLVLNIADAKPLTVTVAMPQPPEAAGFNMGESRRPDGATLTLDSSNLRLNGKPWTPVMGEFHYSRYPANEWREELLKMKGGGVDIVATYVFWIHHEEVEGQFDWSERRSLRHFIELCGEVGLEALVRCGPWCHGEVRNGGQPDWLLKKDWKLRSDDTNYLAKTRILYGQIAAQLKGLLWKDGGPVVGIQFENEYWGPAQHLLTLKQIAREAGLDVPLYTRTGWPLLSTPMPFGEIVPLYGVYAEGFWDREITPMPGQYWSGFHFSLLRTDANIANELLGRRDAKDASDVAQYPYLTCEIGGGMMSSYHRRILVNPADIDSTTLVKLGSGSTSPGYYMYHGGANPEGKLTTMQESQATGYWNDMPVKNYDFQTALGQYGQIRPQYHSLRRLHLFLHEWGPALAGMPATMPDQRPKGKDDVDTLRWCVRSDGSAGFVFVNNYERLKHLSPKENVQFAIKLPSGSVAFPSEPVTVPSEGRFFWPFGFDLGHGVRLTWATAQPLCAADDGLTRTVFFAETPGIPAEFAFSDEARVKVSSGKLSHRDGNTLVRGVKPSTAVALQISGSDGSIVQVVLLADSDSLALWHGAFAGQERLFLTHAGLVLDGQQLQLTSTDRGALTVGIYPAPAGLACGGKKLGGKADGVFHRFTPRALSAVALKASFEQIQPAGPARDIPLGKIKQPVAAAPEDPDFEKAAVWRIKLPADLDLTSDPLLRLDYVGDVARVMLNSKLATDDFYNGRPFEIGLRRHAPEILNGDLRVAILPLRKDAPIYLAKEARPDFGKAHSIGALRRVDIVPRYRVEVTAR